MVDFDDLARFHHDAGLGTQSGLGKRRVHRRDREKRGDAV